ncbi:MAG: homoserine kinase [Cytophagales bacterium]|jgi:homoserine kinase|nr:homoserine kinase [Cytophagales bacterium]MCA6387913.1 homoserine kinase [Cytophagales bacterium]MCA6390993.1 homoserine kinase [Cytophagales bacterium]MCA6396937.1 homoserine kinase [Cytophagales bacterium]MCA6398331.1 homoserine kinase [Cytophagales bacterium]
MKVRTFAPATVANVCCGFDVLGFAVDFPGDEVMLTLNMSQEVTLSKIVGDGGRLPLDASKNTAGVAVQSFLKSIGKQQGVEIELYKNLPLGSGMGSSAASGVAALVAINHLMGNPLTREQLVVHAMEAERIACGSAHADNVAPCLMGGFVLVRDYNPLDVIKIPATKNLYATLVHPQIELKTSDSRRVLKPTVNLKDAIAQTGNIAGLMIGLTSKDYSLISRSLQDKIAEPIRSAFIPGFEQVREAAVRAGALGCGISGSGPTMFALSTDHATATKVGEVMQLEFLKNNLKSEMYVSKVNQEGARILDEK